MNLIVTGGAGFVGNHLVKYLVKKGHNVTVIDNLHKGKKENFEDVFDKIEFFEIDIRDYDVLRNRLKNADGVFHEAALTAVPESFLMPQEYCDVNVYGTENILKLAKEIGFKLVYASSSSVYGDTTKIPIKEDFERKPINPYGQTKLEAEVLAEKYSKIGVKVIGLRYFNIFGIGQTGSYAGVITKFMKNLDEKKPLIINGDGTQVRDFVYVEDVVRANLVAMESKVDNGFFNIGTGIATSIKELAQIMIELSTSSVDLIFSEPLKGDIKKSQADTDLTEKMLGWKFTTDLKSGLQKIMSR
ncbi:MAG: NAD-dependent epimerase/dehydratase family protein [Nitrosopumilales archaeon]|nr:NAD-dependent epimerase/dehydratase family protein [Nitrosopumilales archaeon]